MAVKFIRTFLVAVVLVMSVTNVLFIVENWNMNVAEKTTEPRTLMHKETRVMVLKGAKPADMPLNDGR